MADRPEIEEARRIAEESRDEGETLDGTLAWLREIDCDHAYVREMAADLFQLRDAFLDLLGKQSEPKEGDD